MMKAPKRIYTLAEMQDFDVARILDLLKKWSVLDVLPWVEKIDRFAEQLNLEKPENPIDFSAANTEPFLAHLDELGVFLLKADLRASKVQVDLISDVIKKQGLVSSVAAGYQNLRDTLRKEMSQKCFFCLSDSEKALFQPDKDHPIFGVVVQNNFPSAIYEIDEAAKCLALDRSTATVFHLMRALERTLIAIRRCLNLPDSTDLRDRSWGLILRGLRQEVERRNKEQGSSWGNLEDQHFFSAVIGSMAAVKLAWRDPTMHVERNYLPHEAQEIFAAVRTLMQKVASRMDEEGMPKA